MSRVGGATGWDFGCRAARRGMKLAIEFGLENRPAPPPIARSTLRRSACQTECLGCDPRRLAIWCRPGDTPWRQPGVACLWPRHAGRASGDSFSYFRRTAACHAQLWQKLRRYHAPTGSIGMGKSTVAACCGSWHSDGADGRPGSGHGAGWCRRSSPLPNTTAIRVDHEALSQRYGIATSPPWRRSSIRRASRTDSLYRT
jgi:hypothetical protein